MAVGAYLLTRMTMDSGRATLWLDTAVMGLGLGVAMSAFTTIVQNQYPVHRLGEVSASLQFFRMIGSTVGLAVFGSVLNNQLHGQPRPQRAGAGGPRAPGRAARQRQRARVDAGAEGHRADRRQGVRGPR